MHNRTERDGLEMVNERGVWTLYLVQDDGKEMTALATLNGYQAVNLLSEYLKSDPRKQANDNSKAFPKPFQSL